MQVLLAETLVSLQFGPGTDAARPFCEAYLRQFLCADTTEGPELRILAATSRPEGERREPGPGREFIEKRVEADQIPPWIREPLETDEAFRLGEKTVCASSLDGFLFFDPDSMWGRIVLAGTEQSALRPLHRLLWIYFAQVQAEKGGCFLHAAALARHGKASLFLGPSGAGKSTLARNSRGCRVLSDDGPIVCRPEDRFSVFASPYHQFGLSNGLDPVVVPCPCEPGGLYFLRRKGNEAVTGISRRVAVARIVEEFVHFMVFSPQEARPLSLILLSISAAPGLPLT